jgi:hypothetical protein
VPPPGTPAARRRLADLREQLRTPASHLVDCYFDVDARACPSCPDRHLTRTRYAAYLPEALFRTPEKVRAVLMLVPGGRGGRSRWFLSPVPGKSMFDGGSGGLRTKQRLDAHYAAHPDAAPSIVVALESSGAELNGTVEHLTADVPSHIAATYLPGTPRADIAFGLEGTSSGARALLDAVWARPDAFATLGLTSMACGRLDPRNPHGVGASALEAWAGKLATRHRAGQFFARFAIGARDPLLPCSRALHGLFADAGVLRRDEGWHALPGVAHNYGALDQSWGSQLAWHLAALDAAVHARR